MPKRVPKHSVTTTRSGKIVEAKPGVPFDFTQDEIDHLTERHGKAFLGTTATVEISTIEDEEEPVADQEADQEADDTEEVVEQEPEAEKPAKKVVVSTKSTKGL